MVKDSDAPKSLTSPIVASFAEAIQAKDQEAAVRMSQEIDELGAEFKAQVRETFGPQVLKPAEAVAEFEEQEAELTRLANSDPMECNRRLAVLKINLMCRRTPDQALFDTNHHFDNTGERLLENEYDCTPRLSSDGRSVNIGDAVSAGAGVHYWFPSGGSSDFGVVFARSH